MAIYEGFGNGRVGDLNLVQDTLNQHGYHSIPKRYAIPFEERVIGDNFILQQGSGPKHSSLGSCCNPPFDWNIIMCSNMLKSE